MMLAARCVVATLSDQPSTNPILIVGLAWASAFTPVAARAVSPRVWARNVRRGRGDEGGDLIMVGNSCVWKKKARTALGAGRLELHTPHFTKDTEPVSPHDLCDLARRPAGALHGGRQGGRFP